jgi:thiosulfate dehydrogenase [quinone] large subunit
VVPTLGRHVLVAATDKRDSQRPRRYIVKKSEPSNGHAVIADPPLAKFLFSDTRMAVVWLVVRVYVGYSGLDAGWHKIIDTGAKTNYIIDGQGILTFWQRIAALPVAPAKPAITYDWYRGFIQFLIDNHAEVVMGKVIAFGETAVGVALILGAFVGIAAVGGAFMNLNFMLAGSASTNPVLLLLGFLLVLAWKTAGHIGLDRYLLPILGTPWKAPNAATAPGSAARLPRVA